MLGTNGSSAIHSPAITSSPNSNDAVDNQAPKPLLRASTTFYERVITDWWWWELGSWMVSFACFSTIVGLLLYYDGKKQPEFVVKGITLNAFVAVFAAVAKAALILPVSEAIGQLKWIWFRNERKLVDFQAFDNASRGPLGSALLLSTTKGRHLVSLGAAITVLALAFEPFFQQSLSFSNRIVVTGSGTLPIASSFRPVPDAQYAIHTWYEAARRADSVLGLQIADRLSSGEQHNRSVSAICPTGQCTWAPYSSLAICHKCKDVPRALVPVCQKGTISQAESTGGALNPCGYELNGTIVTGMYGTFERKKISLTTLLVGAKERTTQDVYWNSTHFPNAPHAILDFYVAYVPGGDPQVLRNATPVMLECLFQWCVKTIEASHKDGRLRETVLSTYLAPDVGSTFTPLGGAPHPPFSMVVEGINFDVAANTTQNLRGALMANIPVNLINDTLDASGQYPGSWNFVHNAPYDINTVLNPIADTMSDYLRSSANAGTEQVSGAAWGSEPFIETRWLWMLLPCALLLGTLVLICGTIFKSRKESLPSWKSSALATLLHGLSEEVRAEFKLDASQSEVEALARKIRVGLSLQSVTGRLEDASSNNRDIQRNSSAPNTTAVV